MLGKVARKVPGCIDKKSGRGPSKTPVDGIMLFKMPTNPSHSDIYHHVMYTINSSNLGVRTAKGVINLTNTVMRVLEAPAAQRKVLLKKTKHQNVAKKIVDAYLDAHGELFSH